ncbi:MAG: transporter substrate-binding domain-containing protein [archaeon]
MERDKMRKINDVNYTILSKILLVSALLCCILLAGCSSVQTNNGVNIVKDDSLLKVKERGKLVVGADIPYGIMEFFDENNNPVGIDVDIAREIASGLGVSLEFQDYAWDELFVAIDNGTFDIVISAITITQERSETMLFSIPYFDGGQVIIVRGETQDIASLEDFQGRKMGVQEDTTGEIELKKYINSTQISLYVTCFPDEANPESGMIYDLKNRNIDAIVIDYVAAVDILKIEPGFKIVGEPFTQEYYGIATKLGNAALMSEIDAVLRNMKRNGRLDEIKSKWTK